MSRRRQGMTVGRTVVVRVTGLDGHAAARAVLDDTSGGDSPCIRVPGGVVGDRLRVRLVARGRREWWAELEQVLDAGAARVRPPCRFVDRCGACPWQSVRYPEQLEAKRRTLVDALTGAGHEVNVERAKGIGRPLGYRTKIQMPAGPAGKSLAFGFWAPRSHDFVAAPECVVQHPLGERVRAEITKILRRHGLQPWFRGSGHIRTLLIRVAEGTGQVGAVLVVPDLAAFDWALLAAELGAIDALTGVWVNENSADTNAVLGPRTVHLAGARRLHDRVGGVAFERSAVGFFQTNHRATEQLLELVGEMLPERMPVLWDLYAGGGLFTAYLAGRFDHAELIETHAGACAAARKTLGALEVSATVHEGTVGEVLPELVEAPDAAIVDPPRAGLSETEAAALAARKPPVIVYVSCRQKALIRDLGTLTRAGYRIDRVASVDMFPHTPHLETVVRLVLDTRESEASDSGLVETLPTEDQRS